MTISIRYTPDIAGRRYHYHIMRGETLLCRVSSVLPLDNASLIAAIDLARQAHVGQVYYKDRGPDLPPDRLEVMAENWST